MLVKYRKPYGKIAMGLLSFMPKERDLKNLKCTLHLYEESPEWQLYIWKENEAYLGLIGVKVEENHFTVHHLSVLPSYRGEGLGRAMVRQTQKFMQHRNMRATQDTIGFLSRCQEKMGA